MDPFLLAVLVAAAAVGALIAAVVILPRRTPGPGGPQPPAPIPEQTGALRSYVWLDVESIFDLYEQTPGAAVVQRTKRTRLSGVELGTDGTPVAAKISRSSGDETDTEYLPVKNAARAVSIVERRMQTDGQLTIFDLGPATDDGPLEDLLKNLHTGAGGIGLTVPDDVEKGLRTAWQQKGRRVTGTALESLGQYVRVRARFTISTGADGQEHVLKATLHTDGPGVVEVRIVCSGKHVRPLFPTRFSTVTATCLGIPNWDGENNLLDVQPISVHSS